LIKFIKEKKHGLLMVLVMIIALSAHSIAFYDCDQVCESQGFESE